jgi:hypothetical protein
MEVATQKAGFTANLGFGLALALGIFGSSLYLGSTVTKLKSSDKTIEVKGFAEQKITSDVAVWSGDLISRDVNFAQAYAKLEHNKKRIYSFFEAEDIKGDILSLSPITKEYVYQLNDKGERTNVIEGVILRQNFNLTSHDVQKIATIATKIDQVNGEGIEFESYRPNFYLSSDKLDKIKLDLLGAATKSAQDRAQQIASNSGSGVGKLVNARQGIFQVTPENSTDLSDIGVYDTSTIDKVVKIVVTLSYVIE